MAYQETIFLNGEGNAWYHRNKHKQRPDEVIPLLRHLEIEPSVVLEYGCSDGRRLHGLRQMYSNPLCFGLDPSADAIRAGSQKYPDLNLSVGDAATLTQNNFDLIIYGFCLYVCDPFSLSQIVFCGDRSLQNEGHLVIHDFDPEYPHRVPYKHEPGLFSWKMDYSKLWLANPAYSLVNKTILGDGTAVWVLKKDTAAGWPEEQLP